MNDTVATQLYILFIFLLGGMIIGVFFDVFRILRKSFRTVDVITYIEDALFWIVAGSFVLYLLFTFCNGEIRIYPIIGLLIGTFVYLLTLSKYFIRINVKVILVIKNIIYKILHLLWYPIKLLLKPISFLVINIRREIQNFYKKIKEITKKNQKQPKKEKKIQKIHKKRRNLKTNVEKYK